MDNIVLGSYVPNNTPLHRLDPRIKLLAFITFLVSIFLSYGNTFQNFIMYGFFFVIFLILMIIGKISFVRVLKSFKVLWLMMIMLLILNCCLVTSGNVLFYIGSFPIYDEGIYRTVYIVIRLVMMLMLTFILTSTTKSMELTFAIEWLLAPLNYIKIPVHIFAMVLSLALRFIPTLAQEADKIMKAQASRGVDFKNGKLKDRLKGLVSLVIPMFASCIIHAGELADAMDARGYDPLAKRTKYNRRKWDLADTFSSLVLLVFLGGMIVLAYFQFDFISLIRGFINA